MKKSIFYIAIAVLLLVGFTACQQPMTYKVPTALVATAPNKDYIVDETFDPSTVDLTVIYSDGSSDKLNGSQVPFVADGTDSKVVAAGSTFTFLYGSGDYAVSAPVTVYGYKVVKADLGNLPTTATWASADTTGYEAEFAKGAIEAITVNATLENGATRTLSQATDEVDVVVNSITATANTKADKAFAATVKAFDDQTGISGAAVTYDGKASYTVSVSAKTEDFDETKDYDLVYKLTVGDNEEFDSSDTAYLEQSYSWALYLQNDNGATKPVALNEVYVLNYQNAPSQTGEIGREAVEYEVRLISDKTKTCTVEIPAGKNYITDIKYNKKYVEEYVLTVGKAVTGADIDLEPVYAVKFDETLDTTIEWVADDNVSFIDSATPVADTKFAPQIQIKWKGLDGKEFTKVIKLEAETPAAK